MLFYIKFRKPILWVTEVLDEKMKKKKSFKMSCWFNI